MRIQDNAFLVTGGGSGLGLACAQMLLARGGMAIVIDREPQTGDLFAAQSGDRALCIVADVCDEGQIRQAIEKAVDWSGDSLRGAINCAGIAAGERIVGRNGPHALDTFRRVVEVNLIGTFNVSRLAAAVMARNTPDEGGERGVIVNTSSIAAFEGQIGQAAYAASKGGVASMTLPMSRELAPHGIRAIAIAPGIFETPMMAGFNQNVREALQAETVFPARLGRPDEFATLVMQVIENPMLNGCVLRLDGAMRMH